MLLNCGRHAPVVETHWHRQSLASSGQELGNEGARTSASVLKLPVDLLIFSLLSSRWPLHLRVRVPWHTHAQSNAQGFHGPVAAWPRACYSPRRLMQGLPGMVCATADATTCFATGFCRRNAACPCSVQPDLLQPPLRANLAPSQPEGHWQLALVLAPHRDVVLQAERQVVLDQVLARHLGKGRNEEDGCRGWKAKLQHAPSSTRQAHVTWTRSHQTPVLCRPLTRRSKGYQNSNSERIASSVACGMAHSFGTELGERCAALASDKGMALRAGG